MNTTLIKGSSLCLAVVTLANWCSAQAIPDYFAVKAQSFLQQGAGPSGVVRDSPVFDFSLEVQSTFSLPNVFDTVFVTHNGDASGISPQPLTLDMEGIYEFNFATNPMNTPAEQQSELNSTYDNTSYTFNFSNSATSDPAITRTIDLGKDAEDFPIETPELTSFAGNALPSTFSNLVFDVNSGLSTIDIEWNEFASRDADDFIIVFLEEDDATESGLVLVEQLLAPDATSLSFDTSGLEAGKNYFLDLLFVGVADTQLDSEGNLGVAGFVNETLINVQVVPEPQTYALFGFGLLAAGLFLRRSRKI